MSESGRRRRTSRSAVDCRDERRFDLVADVSARQPLQHLRGRLRALDAIEHVDARELVGPAQLAPAVELERVGVSGHEPGRRHRDETADVLRGQRVLVAGDGHDASRLPSTDTGPRVSRPPLQSAHGPLAAPGNRQDRSGTTPRRLSRTPSRWRCRHCRARQPTPADPDSVAGGRDSRPWRRCDPPRARPCSAEVEPERVFVRTAVGEPGVPLHLDEHRRVADVRLRRSSRSTSADRRRSSAARRCRGRSRTACRSEPSPCRSL